MDKKTILVTAVNRLPVDPEQSLLPLQMVGDRVLIEPIEVSDTLTEISVEGDVKDQLNTEKIKLSKAVNAKEEFLEGVIKSFGGGEFGCQIPAHMKPGLHVCYWHNNKIDFVVEKKVYHMVHVSNVFCYR